MSNRIDIADRVFTWLLLPLCLFLTFNIHSRTSFEANDYHAPLWADAAGYNVYLPAAFIYGFEAQNFPQSSEADYGDGFKLQQEHGLVETKYTYGVALMQAPFFLTAHALTGFEGNGFSKSYQWALMIAAVLYAFMGMMLLKRWLGRLFDKQYVLLTLLFLLAGTNLYYYALEDVGMSHAYSFFLFSAVILGTDNYFKNPNWKTAFLLLLPLALAVLVRPTAGLLVVFIFFYNIRKVSELKERFSFFVSNWKHVLLFAVLVLAFYLPQMLYWKATADSWFRLGYEGEGFDNLLNPQLLSLWFSPKNGLFLYAPILLFCLLGFVFMFRQKAANLIGVLSVFMVASYLFASWGDWSFACSYGSRSFVEYLPLLALPLATVLKTTFELRSKIWKFLLVCVILGMIYVNIEVIYGYDDCFYAAPWDFKAFIELL